jgi:hypothetical protein
LECVELSAWEHRPIRGLPALIVGLWGYLSRADGYLSRADGYLALHGPGVSEVAVAMDGPVGIDDVAHAALPNMSN